MEYLNFYSGFTKLSRLSRIFSDCPETFKAIWKQFMLSFGSHETAYKLVRWAKSTRCSDLRDNPFVEVPFVTYRLPTTMHTRPKITFFHAPKGKWVSAQPSWNPIMITILIDIASEHEKLIRWHLGSERRRPLWYRRSRPTQSISKVEKTGKVFIGKRWQPTVFLINGKNQLLRFKR